MKIEVKTNKKLETIDLKKSFIASNSDVHLPTKRFKNYLDKFKDFLK